MRAYVITIEGDEQSEAGAARLEESHRVVGNRFPLTRFKATTPADVWFEMDERELEWTWPWDHHDVCPVSGLKRHPYKTRDKEARIACFVSHLRLWERAKERGEPLIVMEDDAVWVERFTGKAAKRSAAYHAVGLNDPRGATRRAGQFYTEVMGLRDVLDFSRVPWVDEDRLVPQGLAGASAYIITPEGAGLALALARSVGAWPNDALLCNQLVPSLAVTTTFYTQVQKTPSTLA